MSTPKKEMRKNRVTLEESRSVPRKFDPAIIIEEMLQWAKKEDSLVFAGFCAEHGYMPELIWKFCQQIKEFEEAYVITKMYLAERRERHMNNDQLNYGAWARYQKWYDPFLSKHEDEEADKDMERKKGVANQEKANLFLLAKMAAEGTIKQED